MLPGPALVAAVFLVTGIDEEAVQPRRRSDPDRAALGARARQSRNACWTASWARSAVTQDAVGDSVAAVAVEIDELGEGGLVAITRPFDQPVGHRGLPLAPDSRALRQLKMVEAPERFTVPDRTPLEVPPAFERRLHLGPRPLVDARGAGRPGRRTNGPVPAGSRGRVPRSSHAPEAPPWRASRSATR